MSLIPHSRLPVHIDARSAAPLTLGAVVVATLLLAVLAALAGALPA